MIVDSGNHLLIGGYWLDRGLTWENPHPFRLFVANPYYPIFK